MANRMKGEASFEHDGVTYNLAITMDVLLQAEDETGTGVLELLASNRIGWLGSLLRHAVAAAHGKLMTRSEAAELITVAENARTALRDAFNAAMPPAAEEPEGNA